METVTFNCSHCGKRMGVSKAHLGMQVHCPHCKGVVQSPAPEPPAPAPPEPASPPPLQAVVEPPAVEPPPVEARAAESHAPVAPPTDDIFAPQEGSDIFGESRPSGLEMPPAPPIEAELLHEPAPRPPVPDEAIQEPHENWYDAPKSARSQQPEEFAPPRYRQKSSLLAPMLLMFLIPYSLVTTGYIAWMIVNRPRVPEGLELLPDPPDPKNKDRGVERVKHDGKLPDHLKTVMNEPLQVGDIEVTPVKVRYENADLILKLKLRNKSSQYAFNPLPDHFVNMLYYQSNKPYTFLDPGAKELRCYGGFVAPSKDDGKLQPGEEMFVELITADRDKTPEVMKLTKPLVWRVQLRRGMVETRKGDQPATAVVGVEFTVAAIEKAAG
jgi:phage FluMu protein Com